MSNGALPPLPVIRMLVCPATPGHIIEMHSIGLKLLHAGIVGAGSEQVLSTETLHGSTQVISPGSLTCEALMALAVAVLFIAVQALRLVAAVTTAVKVALCASEPMVQPKLCEPSSAARRLAVQPVVAVAQVTPPPTGSGSSVSATPVAV